MTEHCPNILCAVIRQLEAKIGYPTEFHKLVLDCDYSCDGDDCEYRDSEAIPLLNTTAVNSHAVFRPWVCSVEKVANPLTVNALPLKIRTSGLC